MKKIVLVTGGFDPLHSGHIAYLEAAKRLGDRLVVGVNSDAWLNDDDGTARHAIQMTRESYPQQHIIFANGGDRTPDNIPEMDIADTNTHFEFGVGGFDKANSSSWILEEWKAPRTQRAWGHYRVLYDAPGTKVKELTVMPGQRLSMQRHQDRAEHWHVAQGTATVYGINRKSAAELLGEFGPHQHTHIGRGEWHQLCNLTDEPLQVVEIQYGVNCVEEDIERQ